MHSSPPPSPQLPATTNHQSRPLAASHHRKQQPPQAERLPQVAYFAAAGCSQQPQRHSAFAPSPPYSARCANCRAASDEQAWQTRTPRVNAAAYFSPPTNIAYDYNFDFDDDTDDNRDIELQLAQLEATTGACLRDDDDDGRGAGCARSSHSATEWARRRPSTPVDRRACSAVSASSAARAQQRHALLRNGGSSASLGAVQRGALPHGWAEALEQQQPPVAAFWDARAVATAAAAPPLRAAAGSWPSSPQQSRATFNAPAPSTSAAGDKFQFDPLTVAQLSAPNGHSCEDDYDFEGVAVVPALALDKMPLSSAQKMRGDARAFVLSQRGAARKSGARVRRTLRVKVPKSRPMLGIAIEGGFNVGDQLLPRIVCVHEQGAAYECGQLRAGDVILEVNRQPTANLSHEQITSLIANAYYSTTTTTGAADSIEFLIGESLVAHK